MRTSRTSSLLCRRQRESTAVISEIPRLSDSRKAVRDDDVRLSAMVPSPEVGSRGSEPLPGKDS